MLDEYHPKVVHISGVDNNVANALFRLDIIDIANNARDWDKKSKRLEYINIHMMNICMFLSETEFEEDDFDNDAVMTMSKVDDPSYPLDLKSMREAQLIDDNLIRILKNHLSGRGKNNTIYTYKTVEDIKLAYKTNQILVPRSKLQNVLDWYHTVLIHSDEARMVESIKLVFTWSGLNKQAKELVKTSHKCQICKKVGKKKYGLLSPNNVESMR